MSALDDPNNRDFLHELIQGRGGDESEEARVDEFIRRSEKIFEILEKLYNDEDDGPYTHALAVLLRTPKLAAGVFTYGMHKYLEAKYGNRQ